jgi:hypothetical protein
MSIPAVLVRLSTGEILKHLDLSLVTTDTTQPIAGLDPDLKYYVKVQPYSPPEYDERYYTLNQINTITDTAPAGFHASFGQYVTTFTTSKRTAAEIKEAIDNAERQALTQLCNTEKQLKLTLQFIGSLDRKVAEQSLTTRESTALNELAALHVKVSQNADIAAQKKALVDIGQEPDLDADWVRS